MIKYMGHIFIYHANRNQMAHDAFGACGCNTPIVVYHDGPFHTIYAAMRQYTDMGGYGGLTMEEYLVKLGFGSRC